MSQAMIRQNWATDDRKCGTCGRGVYRADGAIACGAAVDQDALLGRGGINPIWAERKYSLGRIGGLAAALARAQSGLPPDQESDAKVASEPEGSDAECMHPNDGATCKTWLPHPEIATDEDWHDITVLGCPYQEQISNSGRRRHRPLRLVVGRGDFDQELGVGDWRPGAAPRL